MITSLVYVYECEICHEISAYWYDTQADAEQACFEHQDERHS